MIDWTKPIRQKNGRRAVFVGRALLAAYPITIYALERDGNWVNMTYTENGKHCTQIECSLDLENIPEESR